MDDILDVLKIICLMVLLTVIVGGLFMGLSVLFEYNYCQTLQSITTTYDFQWVFWGGCRVLVNGFWMHADDVNLINLQVIEP